MKLAALPILVFFTCSTLVPLKAGPEGDEEMRFPQYSSGNDPELTDTDSLFNAGNQLYENEAYEAALEAYHAVILGGKESADLYYNMGNAAFRSNSIGHAVLYYEKALKMDPSHEDAAHNLDFVSRYRADAFEEVPVLFLTAWVRGFVQLFPEHTWSILSMIFFLLVLSGIILFLYSRSVFVKKLAFISALTAILFFSVSLSSAISRHRDIVNPDTGIILVPSVVVRSSPSESGTELFILHEGTKIEVNEEVGAWQNIRLVDGREGWIMKGDFQTI
jgi:hypothetical protein